jgi:hypothetical protein
MTPKTRPRAFSASRRKAATARGRGLRRSGCGRGSGSGSACWPSRWSPLADATLLNDRHAQTTQAVNQAAVSWLAFLTVRRDFRPVPGDRRVKVDLSPVGSAPGRQSRHGHRRRRIRQRRRTATSHAGREQEGMPADDETGAVRAVQKVFSEHSCEPRPREDSRGAMLPARPGP